MRRAPIAQRRRPKPATPRSVNGQKVQRISFVAPDNTPATTLFEALGLKVVASCGNTGALEMHAVPTTTDSEIQVFGDSNNTFFSFEDSSFGVRDRSNSLTESAKRARRSSSTAPSPAMSRR